MQLKCFTGHVMDFVMNLLLRRSNYLRASFVIPTHYATQWFYEGSIDEDFEKAKFWLTKSFITAVNVHSSSELRMSGGKKNHWIFFCRDKNGVLHVYDPCGKEQYYKRAFIQPLFSKLYFEITGEEKMPKFDDEVRGDIKRKDHFKREQNHIQEPNCICCGPIVLREAERWLRKEVTKDINATNKNVKSFIECQSRFYIKCFLRCMFHRQ